MPAFNLSKIAQITEGKLHGDGEQVIEFLEIDSRRINHTENSIFIAIKGIRHDGHTYVHELYEKGFKNFILEGSSFIKPEWNHVNYIVVQNAITALQKLASAYRKMLKMPLTAITGSNGKTVVKEWLFQCLSHEYIVSRSPKSYNSQVGVPLSVWLLNEEADWSVVEAGISRPGEMEKLEEIIQPDYGIITNLGPAHQKNFGSLEEKANEKLRLFVNSEIIFYCYDHKIIHEAIMSDENLRTKQLVNWSKDNPACYLYASKIEKKQTHTHLHIVVNKNTCKLFIPFTDDASIENCLHIITFLLHRAYTIPQLQNALDQLTPVAMRLEQIKGAGNSTIINDSYNSDVNSLRIALDFLAVQKQHQKHALILSDIKQSGKPDEDLYSDVLNLIRSYRVDKLILVGPHISQSNKLPENSLRFNSTEELMTSLPRIDLSDHAILVKGARKFGFELIVDELAEKKHTTILEINLSNLVSNLNYFRGQLKADTRIMVMVKALSYGSGSYEIANLLQHEKVDCLGVAFTDEGVELRKAGITLPIMVMSPTPENYDDVIEYGLEPEIFHFTGLDEMAKTLTTHQIPEYPVQIKLDTGMHRLGFMPKEIPELIKRLEKSRNLRVKAIFSHLAASDNPEEDAFTLRQIDLFTGICDTISKRLGYQPVRHILNSAGIERFPQAHFDMVRLGIGLHGISSINKKLRSVSTLKTKISQIKEVTPGDTIGYNRHGKVKNNARIGIIPVGYADGLNRKLGNYNGMVWVRNKLVPFIGDICMDMCMIDVTGLHAEEGEEVVVFGEKNPIHEIAKKIGTIPYEVLTGISTRVKRIYINE
ncbi:MAG: bifunctional UDP-N-acetylmuramoyl-tripeptide:D-alanyl-D-alanine ligase/alanine racemase [Bacteroidales bacterium]|jgi:alanine racemase